MSAEFSQEVPGSPFYETINDRCIETRITILVSMFHE